MAVSHHHKSKYSNKKDEGMKPSLGESTFPLLSDIEVMLIAMVIIYKLTEYGSPPQMMDRPTLSTRTSNWSECICT